MCVFNWVYEIQHKNENSFDKMKSCMYSVLDRDREAIENNNCG